MRESLQPGVDTVVTNLPFDVQGIRAYLAKHKYGNAKTSDLWASLTEASGKDVADFMGVWTKKIGYPVVSVSTEGGKLKMTQV